VDDFVGGSGGGNDHGLGESVKKYYFVLTQHVVIEAYNVAQAFKRISGVKAIGEKVFFQQGKHERIATHGYVTLPDSGRIVRFEGKNPGHVRDVKEMMEGIDYE